MYHDRDETLDTQAVITSGQLRAARALLNLDRQTLTKQAGLSLPTIQRMESA